MKSSNFYGYKAAVAMGIFCFFATGMVNLYAYLMPSAMVRLNCTAAQLTAVTAVMGIVSFLSSFIAGKAYAKFGAEKCQIFYGITGAMYATGFIFAESIYILFVLAALMGLFSGMGGTAAISVYISDWFIDKRQEISGYVTSTCTFGGFVAGMIFSFLATSMEPEKAALILMAAFGAICAGILISCLGIFYLTCATIIMSDAGMDIAVSSRIYSMVTMSMGVGSILVGNLFAKLGCKKALTVVYGLMLLSLIGLAYWCGNPGSVALITAVSIVFGFADSGLVLLPVMSYSELFGMKSFSRMMPIMVAISVVAATCCGTLMSSVYAAYSNWVTPTIFSIVLMAIGAVCVIIAFLFSPMKKKVNF